MWIAITLERLLRRRHRSEPDQVGVVVFAVVGRGQPVARDIEFEGRLSRSASSRVATPFSVCHQMVLGFARMRHLELARAVPGRQRAVSITASGVFGEGPKPDGAAHAMRSADTGDTDRCSHRGRRSAYALAAASACALRSLRGTAFSGLLRAVRLTTPAASRKR